MTVFPDVVDELKRATAAASPRETGGLVLGWWERNDVVARFAVEVPDPCASHYSWTRTREHAQNVLDKAVAAYDHPWLGYVGDWHSHPAAIGASVQDLDSIRRASLAYNKPLLLLVHHGAVLQDARGAFQGRSTKIDLVIVSTPERNRS